MRRAIANFLTVALLVLAAPIVPARSDEQAVSPRIQEEIWALPLPLPMFAYLVRPVGYGPFPLAIMNHGVSLNPTDRSFFPLVEFRGAAKWFAKRGYLVMAQVDLWIIDYLAAEQRIVPKDVIVVGQSAGGWASIALSSVNPPQVKAIITFAAGRGGR